MVAVQNLKGELIQLILSPFFQSLKVLTINVGTLSSLAACSTQDKKLDSCIN
jgi:hypothetical protein